MLTEPRSCKKCTRPIEQNKRRDSLFCSVICRRAFWESSGKRHKTKRLNIPTPLTSSKIEPLKASDYNKISEVDKNEMQTISLSKLSTSQ